jgi:RNase H-fold protein (predicted Holliday junction resolvase)
MMNLARRFMPLTSVKMDNFTVATQNQ